jgi:hypothetical protein
LDAGTNSQLSAEVLRTSQQERISMKNVILVAFAVLSLTAAMVPTANANSTIAGDAQATRQQQTGSYSQ